MTRQTDEVGLLGDIASLNKAGYAVEFRPVPDGLLKCSIRHYGEVSVAEFHGYAITYPEALFEAKGEMEKATVKGKRK